MNAKFAFILPTIYNCQTVLDILVQWKQTLQLSLAAAAGSLLKEMDSLPEIKEGLFKQFKTPPDLT